MAYILWTQFGNSCSRLIFIPKLLTDLEVIGCRFQTGNFLTVASRVSQTQHCSTQQIQLTLISLKHDISDKNALCHNVYNHTSLHVVYSVCTLWYIWQAILHSSHVYYGVSSDDRTVSRPCDMSDMYVHHFVYSESHQVIELAVLHISHVWCLLLYV